MSTATTAAVEAAEKLGLPRPELTVIKFSDLIVDSRVQRPEDPRKLGEMTAHFEPAALGVVSVSFRRGGTKVILDGQHRMKAALANEFDEEVPSFAWEDLELAQEAALFRLLNNTTKAGAMALFNVAVTEQNPEAMAIQSIFDQYGLVLANGDFGAIRTAMRIAAQPGGVGALRWAIDVVNTAWGPGKNNMNGVLIEALAMLYQRHGTLIDTQVLRNKLASRASGVQGLLGDARTVVGLKRGRLQVAMIEVLIGAYNYRRSSNALPEWVR